MATHTRQSLSNHSPTEDEIVVIGALLLARLHVQAAGYGRITYQSQKTEFLALLRQNPKLLPHTPSEILLREEHD